MRSRFLCGNFSETIIGHRFVCSSTSGNCGDCSSNSLPNSVTRFPAIPVRRCSNAPITQFFRYQQKKPVFTNRKEVPVKFSIRKQGPAMPVDREKITCVSTNAVLPVASSPAIVCNSSNQTRSVLSNPQTPNSLGATFITSPTSTPLTGATIVKNIGQKGRLTPARVAVTSVSGQPLNRCSPVAVRVASPASNGSGGPSSAVVSVSGVSAGVSVITTGGTLGGHEGSPGVLGSSGSVGVGGVQVFGCQQLQVEKGAASGTAGGAGSFAGGSRVRPEAKVEGGRNSLTLQVSYRSSSDQLVATFFLVSASFRAHLVDRLECRGEGGPVRHSFPLSGT